ncbi:MAG TPA: 4Fe-4S dicluster domain-containing protein [Longimicrobiales bacterium]|nr:4Fe-4S dicluster domain-containing protein [Longimicrobiales bacterium]
MCPSYRATRDERHSTRGRANALRLAVTGQLGPKGLHSPEMAEALSLCVSCKGCKRECPTGVDMAKLKIEWLHLRNRRRGIPLRERFFAELPRLAPRAAPAAHLLNRIGRNERARSFAERRLGIASTRALPAWSARPWSDEEASDPQPDVLLFVDTFTRWFEPEVARASLDLLRAGAWRVGAPPMLKRPLCCGRTYLSAGMIGEARVEAERLVSALARPARDGVLILGLEPSCLFTLRDEVPALVGTTDAGMVAEHAHLLEEFLSRSWDRGRTLPLREDRGGRVLVHGHCHQKAHDATEATLSILRRIPGAEVEEIRSGCCGMAGAFGYQAEHQDVSFAMGELDLLPAVRAAGPDDTLVADGTSCRAQIRDGTGREARHVALVLREALAAHQPVGARTVG